MSKPSQVIELWENKEGRRQMWDGEIDTECCEASCVNPVATKGVLTFPGRKEAAQETGGYLSSVSSKNKAGKDLASNKGGLSNSHCVLNEAHSPGFACAR